MGPIITTCDNCGRDIEMWSIHHTLCLACWKKMKLKKWQDQGCPERVCDNCGRDFYPKYGFEKTCYGCWKSKKDEEVERLGYERMKPRLEAMKKEAKERKDG